MAHRRTPSRQPPDDGHADTHSTAAQLRQPNAELGPRAHRTVRRITDAARSVLLARGYAGTTIDEIARIADMSRASFYTYFASKREVLLAVGAHSSSASDEMIDRLPSMGGNRAGIAAWVREYFIYLEQHGSVAFAWTQAAREDEAIRTAGMKRHLASCRLFGRHLAAAAGRTSDSPTLLGLTAFSLLERSWSYGEVYTDAIQQDDLIEHVASALWAAAHEPSPRTVGDGNRPKVT